MLKYPLQFTKLHEARGYLAFVIVQQRCGAVLSLFVGEFMLPWYHPLIHVNDQVLTAVKRQQFWTIDDPLPHFPLPEACSCHCSIYSSPFYTKYIIGTRFFSGVTS